MNEKEGFKSRSIEVLTSFAHNSMRLSFWMKDRFLELISFVAKVAKENYSLTVGIASSAAIIGWVFPDKKVGLILSVAGILTLAVMGLGLISGEIEDKGSFPLDNFRKKH